VSPLEEWGEMSGAETLAGLLLVGFLFMTGLTIYFVPSRPLWPASFPHVQVLDGTVNEENVLRNPRPVASSTLEA
jgi:hypothetical protein